MKNNKNKISSRTGIIITIQNTSYRQIRLPMTSNPWPELPLAEWKDTFETLHMWTQIVGKIR
ncbi:MAG TPA: DUF5996 family protein, partial [Nitrososphaeraceae archaeon]|nr:DUF5996 family protein [Nitrososphaeraceae archaeon]